MTTPFICITCGTQSEPSDGPPRECPICLDERQYVGLDGQQWTSPEMLRATHHNTVTEVDPGVFSIHTEPKFGIGQRCLLVQSPAGNVLWDCVSLLDDATTRQLRGLGGVRAIAISHPHYYTTMVEWSETFEAPVYLHEDDRRWVMRQGNRLQFWSGETHPIGNSLTLIRCGGHFKGAQVMHDGVRRALFTGDVIQVVPDRRWVSFMRSYPNYIPLPEKAVRKIVASVEPFEFETIYGAWPKFEVRGDAKGVVRRSAERYVAALGGAGGAQEP